MVVLFHHSTPLRLGGWAVGLFFCLSGFWIAEMWSSKYSTLDRPYLEFIVSRWWRLAPVMLFTTMLAAALMSLDWVPGDTRVLHQPLWWFMQIIIVGSTFHGHLLPTTWSLDVEMQFYLLAPLVIVVVGRLPGKFAAAVAALGIAFCAYTSAHSWSGPGQRIDIWLGVFLLGVIASTHHCRPGKKFAMVSAAATLLVFTVAAAVPATRPWILLRGSVALPPTGWLPAVLSVGSIVLAAPLALATTTVRSSRFDRFLGDLSYPLYLVHWLPRNWYYAHLGNHFHMATASMLLSINILCALGSAVAILFIIDRPIQRVRARWVLAHERQLVPYDAGTTVPAIQANQPFAGTV